MQLLGLNQHTRGSNLARGTILQSQDDEGSHITAAWSLRHHIYAVEKAKGVIFKSV